MPDSFLGDGLIFEDTLPIGWTPGALAEDRFARLNADNQQLLTAYSTLDEVRVNDALKDESPAMVHELQRLDFKLNILLRITADLAMRQNGLPQTHKVRFSSLGLEWAGNDAPPVDEIGLVVLYVNTVLPQPLRLPATVISTGTHKDAQVTQLQFTGLSESVVELIEKMIFRHHRRLVAGAKLSSPRHA
jgi:atypical PilZ domain-containing cyclic di-GMP receptor